MREGRRLKLLVWVFILAVLQGCSTVAHKPMPLEGSPQNPRKIAIFFDGTHNDEASDTNVKKLHNLVSLQQKEGLATLWIEADHCTNWNSSH